MQASPRDRRYKRREPGPLPNGAFTLLELLVVMAIVGILAGLVLGGVSRAKQKAQATQCLSNLRQLQTGWTLYISDHEDALPPNNDRPEAGRDAAHASWVAGWLRTAYEAGDHSDNTNTELLVGKRYAAFGSIGVYVEDPAVYRCPGDKSGRVRSVSMNCYLNGTGAWQQKAYVTFRHYGEIGQPSRTWVFIDEREDSINDGYFAVDMGARYAVIDYPASYHGGAGALAFADGHAEVHRWVEPTTQPPLRRGYHLPGGAKYTSPQDRDMQWLIERTTVRRRE